MKSLKLLFSLLLIVGLFLSCPINPGSPKNDPPVQENYEFTLNIVGEGTVTGNASGTYLSGTELTLTAVPDSGNIFYAWSGQIDSSDSLLNITINSDLSITANFIEETIPLYTVTATTSGTGSGSITMDPDLDEYAEGSVVTVSASPDSDSLFSGWSGDLSGSDNPETVTVSSDINIDGEFTEKPAWTALIHFAVDNELDYTRETIHGNITACLETLAAIETLDTGNKLNIVLMIDASNAEGNFDDGYYFISGGSPAGDLIVDLAEIDSGSVSETEDWMDWAVENYPSQHYLYSIFGPGGGFFDASSGGDFGTGIDESSADSLSRQELGQTAAYLSTVTGEKVALFYAFASLLGGIETAYEVRDSADYLLGSEDDFPVTDWSYEALGEIITNPDITAEELGTAFCDSAYTYYSDPGVNMEYSLSLIDLSLTETLFDSIDSFAEEAIDDIGSDFAMAGEYNREAEDSWSMNGDFTDYYLMDLGDYLDRIQDNFIISSDARSAAAAAETALNNTVVYSTNNDADESTGLTILHNLWYSGSQYDLSVYETIYEFGANTWTDYITLLRDLAIVMAEDAYEADNDLSAAKPITVGAAAQEHTFHTPGDEDFMSVVFSAGSTYIIETNGNTVACNTDLYLYDNVSADPADYIAYSDDLGANFYSRIYYACETGGTYYIRVAENLDAVGDYLIDVTVSAAPLPDPDAFETGDADMTNVFQPGDPAHNRTFHDSPDPDYYHLDLSGETIGTEIKIETYADSQDCDTTIILLDYNTLSIISFDDDGGTGNYSRLVFTYDDPGIDYFIIIKESDYGIGDYLVDCQSGTFAAGMMSLPDMGMMKSAVDALK